MSESNQKTKGVIYTKFGDFGFLPLIMLKDKNVTFNMMKIYIVLAYHQRGNDNCWPSIQTISRETGISRNSVIAAIKKLVLHKWVEKTANARGKTNNYNCLTKIYDNSFVRDSIDKRAYNKHNIKKAKYQIMRPVPVSKNETQAVSINETLIDNEVEQLKDVFKYPNTEEKQIAEEPLKAKEGDSLYMPKITKEQQRLLVESLKVKVSFIDSVLWPVAARWGGRFGVDLCLEMFERIPDLSERESKAAIGYIEKTLQNEYILRNGSQMPNISFGR